MMIIDPFGGKESTFKKDDVVCHCFQFTRRQIEEDVKEAGRSRILEKITTEKNKGGCDCARKNPKGR